MFPAAGPAAATHHAADSKDSKSPSVSSFSHRNTLTHACHQPVRNAVTDVRVFSAKRTKGSRRGGVQGATHRLQDYVAAGQWERKRGTEGQAEK